MKNENVYLVIYVTEIGMMMHTRWRSAVYAGLVREGYLNTVITFDEMPKRLYINGLCFTKSHGKRHRSDILFHV